MTTPKKDEIIEKARELWVHDQYKNGCAELAGTNPEIEELREGGYLSAAQSELMRNPNHDEWDGFNERLANLQKTLVNEHDSVFPKLVSDIKGHLGSIICGESSHGKSFLAFSVVREAMEPKNKTRVIVFSPSTIWNRKFGSGNIRLIKVGTANFSPIIDYDKVKIETVPNIRDTFFLNTDKKYLFKRSEWLEHLLADDSKHLIIELHYLNSRKIKAFVSECLRLVFERMKATLEKNPEYDRHVLFVLEESQNIYSTYSLNDDNSLVTHAILTLARTDSNCHFLAITQRLAELSVKVTERLRLISGLQIGFNSLNRVRSQITPKLRKVVQKLPPRTFLYVNGKDNPIFKFPEYRYNGKPTQLFAPKPKQKLKPEMSKLEGPYILAMKPKAKRSSLRAWFKVLKFLFWVDRGDLDKPNYKVKPARLTAEPETNEDDLGAEHQLVADNEDEESEALFW